MFLYGQGVEENIVLRTETKTPANFRQIVPNVVAANHSVTSSRLQKPYNTKKQRNAWTTHDDIVALIQALDIHSYSIVWSHL